MCCPFLTLSSPVKIHILRKDILVLHLLKESTGEMLCHLDLLFETSEIVIIVLNPIVLKILYLEYPQLKLSCIND